MRHKQHVVSSSSNTSLNELAIGQNGSFAQPEQMPAPHLHQHVPRHNSAFVKTTPSTHHNPQIQKPIPVMATNKNAAPKLVDHNLKELQLKKDAQNLKDEKPNHTLINTATKILEAKNAKSVETKIEHVEVKKTPEIITFVS